MYLAQQYPQEFRRVAEKAWSDESFHTLLLNDPIRACEQEGIPVPEALRASGVNFKVVADSDTVKHIVLPARPADELSDLELALVAGGKNSSSPVTTGKTIVNGPAPLPYYYLF